MAKIAIAENLEFNDVKVQNLNDEMFMMRDVFSGKVYNRWMDEGTDEVRVNKLYIY